jgi:hypothetical protein
LRGALEAARLREEKHKAEMERYTKELEALRWENMNSRRGEVEVGARLFSSFFFFFSDGCDAAFVRKPVACFLINYGEAPGCSSSSFNSNSELLADALL